MSRTDSGTGTDDTAAVLAAAARLVAAFAGDDPRKYFACFSPTATFVFHTTAVTLAARAEYEALWATWVAEGFEVHSCSSTEGAVTFVGAGRHVAVFTHRVLTDASTGGQRAASRERESIVFVHEAERWVAVHEHLSPDPSP